MKDNIFKTEILDYASKLDAVTNSYGEIVKAASAIVEEHDNSSTVYLINHTSKLIKSAESPKDLKRLANALKDSIMKFYGYHYILESQDMGGEVDNDTRSLDELLEDLNKLIGLEGFKEKVNDLIAFQTVQLLREKQGLHSHKGTMHLAFTGNPGTGKTTTINTIIKLLEDLKLSIALAAPTGRAAKRMSQVTGYEAKTIHRLLCTQRSSEGYSIFTHNEENPLPYDVIILDEVSMIDVNLMSSFLKAVKTGARIILSGDADQLPSVGPGNIIHDIIESKTIPVIQLNKIFRQAEESLIIVNAHKINHGELPDLSVKSSDFFFLRRKPQDSAFTVMDLFKNRLPKSYNVNPISSIQVLSPTKKGLAGTIALNKLLQSHINPYDERRPQHVFGNITFRVGDKVMQTKNNYDMVYSRENGEDGMGIFNGDMGIIESISVRDKCMNIVFDEDKLVEYPFTNLDELDLAYAITVHKSQGSEFPIVIMPVCSFSPMLMSRNLFYTAVTRARDMVVLVGSEKTIQNMTMNNQFHQRFTGLTEKLVAVKKFVAEKEENS